MLNKIIFIVGLIVFTFLAGYVNNQIGVKQGLAIVAQSCEQYNAFSYDYIIYECKRRDN